jgi:hypothetical protein
MPYLALVWRFWTLLAGGCPASKTRQRQASYEFNSKLRKQDVHKQPFQPKKTNYFGKNSSQ